MVRKPVLLTLKMSPEAGFCRVAGPLLDAFSIQLKRVMSRDDPEGPHQARIALRRFRSALTGFSPLLEPSARREMARQARELFRGLGRLRDADVLLAGCRDPKAIAGLAADADLIRSAVRADLTAMDAAGFSPRMGDMLDGGTWRRKSKRGRRWRRRGLDRLGRRALRLAWMRCLKHGPKLPSMKPEERHALRKDLKTLRYLSDFFATFWPGGRRDRFLIHLRSLQDSLGTLNDQMVACLSEHALPTPTKDKIDSLAEAGRSWKALRKIGPWWE